MALLRGRLRAVPQDVYDVAYDILNARLALSYRALAEGFTIDDVLVDLLTTVPAPGSMAWPPPVPSASTVPPPPAYSTQVASAYADTAAYVNQAPEAPSSPMQGQGAPVSTPWGATAQTPPIVLPDDPASTR
jgi:hypothetical protein